MDAGENTHYAPFRGRQLLREKISEHVHRSATACDHQEENSRIPHQPDCHETPYGIISVSRQVTSGAGIDVKDQRMLSMKYSTGE